jgi:uncharacterized SAM-binding protein YcdF (DUF218 family)
MRAKFGTWDYRVIDVVVIVMVFIVVIIGIIDVVSVLWKKASLMLPREERPERLPCQVLRARPWRVQ